MAGKESMTRQRTLAMRDLMKNLIQVSELHTDLGSNLEDHIGDMNDEIKSTSQCTQNLDALLRFAENEYVQDDLQLALAQSKSFLRDEQEALAALQKFAKARDAQRGTLEVVISRMGAHYDYLLDELLTAIGANPSKFRCGDTMSRSLAEVYLDNDMQVLVNSKVIVSMLQVTFVQDKLTSDENVELAKLGFSPASLYEAATKGKCMVDLNALDVIKLSQRDSVTALCMDSHS